MNLSWLIDLIVDLIVDAPSKKRSGRSSNRATGRYRGSPNEQGERGEARVNLWASQELDSKIYDLIPDVMLPTPDGTTQIDHLIVSRYGIFVLETKAYNGWIYGGERDARWTQVLFRSKERFQNPLRQNHKHVKILAGLTGIPENFFKPLVVFVGDAEFKSEMPANVVKLPDLVQHIQRFQIPIIKTKQVPEVVSAIREWAGTVDDERKAQHVQNLVRSKEPVAADAPAPPCPYCGTVMVLRTNRKAGNQFWGCRKYPECKGLRQTVDDLHQQSIFRA